MKKILIAIILLISFITNGHSKVISIACKEINLYLSKGQNFENLENMNNYRLSVSDKSSTLIIEPDYKNNENNTTGRITLIHEEKIDYFFISTYSHDYVNDKPSRFEAYNYSKITKEDAKKFKSLKPFVGQFSQNSFLSLEQVKSRSANTFYNLSSISVIGLYSVDSYASPIFTAEEKFICKE
tara:strand:- start:94 stop:642 length:549 start_codon:yes stop_codon:yes gene_type:complete